MKTLSWSWSTRINEIKKYFPGLIFLITGLIYDFYIFVNPGKWYIENDMASEMVLADMLNKEHSILSKNWVYSTEIRILCQQWFLRIGLWLYPDNWHRARIIGALLMLMVSVPVFYAFFRCMKMPAHWAIVAAAIMVWPFGRDYYLFVVWGLYYLSHIAWLALGFYLFYRLVNALNDKKNKQSIVLILLSLILSALLGLGGIRMTYVLYAPLFASTLVLFLYTAHIRELDLKDMIATKEAKAVGVSLMLFVVDVIGFLVNTHVLTKIYSFANLGAYFCWKDNFDFTIEELLRGYLFQFGYQRGTNVLTFEGISTALGLGFALLVVVCSFRLLFRLAELSFSQRIVVIFYHCSFLIHLIMLYCFAGSSNYWLTILPFSIAVVFVELTSEKFSISSLNCIVATLMTIAVVCCSISTVRTESTTDLDYGNPSVYQAAKWLVDNDYYEGFSLYAPNVLTEFSDGKIQVWRCQLEGATSIDIASTWLTPKDKLNSMPEGKVFIMHYSVTDGPVENCPLLKNGKLEFENGYLRIWTFDSVDAILDGI